MITHNDVSKWLDDKGYVSTTVAAEMTGREPGGHIKDLMVGNNVRSVKVTIDAQGDFPVSRSYWYMPDVNKVPVLNAKPKLIDHKPVNFIELPKKEQERIAMAWIDNPGNIAWFYVDGKWQENGSGGIMMHLPHVIKSDFDLTGTGLEQCNVTAN